MGQRKTDAREFKVEALRMLNAGGKNSREVEADLGIGSDQIYRWPKRLVAEGTQGSRAFLTRGRAGDE